MTGGAKESEAVEERTNGKMIGREALPIGGILQDGVDRLLHQSPPRREVQHHLKNKVLGIVSIHSNVSEGLYVRCEEVSALDPCHTGYQARGGRVLPPPRQLSLHNCRGR